MQSLLDWQRGFAANFSAAYRSNIYGNWENALAGAYPVVRKIVGAEFFRAMAHAYARAHPSASGDLNEYGTHLAEFTAMWEHTQDLPYLPDVARMEWLAHRAYYAADAAPFDFGVLAGGAPDTLRAVLAPSCALLASEWPLARIWEVHQDDYPGAPEVDLRGGGERILVHRPRWRAQVSALGAGDYRFLEAAQAGATLEDALAAAAIEDPGFDPGEAPARWVDAGVIARLER